MSNRKKPRQEFYSMKRYKTEQEDFWAGSFGDEYVERNQGKQLIASNTALFTKILSRTINVHSVIEFGANIGMNLAAIRHLLPDASLAALEINTNAAAKLRETGHITVYNQSILDFDINNTYDFVLIKGVLIHINPEELTGVYDKLYNSSGKYICIAEYYNPCPVEISYRGHSNRLFKRDFAGEMLKKFPTLKLVDYGFVYHGDFNYPQDDITWFLLEKTM